MIIGEVHTIAVAEWYTKMKATDKMMALGIKGIDVSKLNTDQLTVCPQCTPNRKKKRQKDLSIRATPECVIYKCHHCGFQGAWYDDKNDKDKTYFKPKWKNQTSLSDAVVKWFKSRGIDQQVLIDCKVTEGKEWMPQTGKDENCIHFNYFKNDQLINVKYRDGKKNFRQVKDAEKIVYGWNDAIGVDTLIWVEGEMDKLSFYQAGYKNVWSVPDGAPAVSSECCSKPVIYKPNDTGHFCRECGKSCKTKQPNYASKFDFMDNSHFIWSEVKNHVIATDADPAGDLLADELARRIGKSKCKRVHWDKSHKDANGALMDKGSQGLINAIETSQEFPLEGVFYVPTLRNKIYNLYSQGMMRGDTVGYNYVQFDAFTERVKPFDDLISFSRSLLMVITGVPTHGKSNFWEQILLLLSVKHGWKHGLFSPEHYPIELHFARLAEMYIGTRFFEGQNNETRMTGNSLDKAIEFIGDHFYFVRPENDDFTPHKILDVASNLVAMHGISCMTIDPWNRLYHDYAGMAETKYVEDTLRRFNVWKQEHDCLLSIVAHPTKMSKDKTGVHEVPSLYNISGSAHWYNMVDLGMTVYRDFENDIVSVYVQKVKHRGLGDVGFTKFKYNLENSRYHQFGTKPNNDPYYAKDEKQGEMKMPEKPYGRIKIDRPPNDLSYKDNDLPF